jgi:RHS repeat-associated protein
MKTRLFVTLSLAACMFFAVVPMTTFAQITPDVAEGLTPYQSFQGGDIDAVNLSNGNVMIRIPLVSYPQRGNTLKWGRTYVDNTKEAASGQICVGTSGCYYQWEGSAPNSVPVVFDTLIDDQSAYYVQTLYTLPKNGQWAAYAVVSSGGAVHPIDLNPSVTNYETMDATGFTLNPSGTGWLTAPTLIVDRNGNRFASLREDTNGNELFTPALPYGDTVGRQFPNGTATTDYSGCVGPLPTAAAYNLSYPGPGGSVTYKLCDANVPINIPSTETPGVTGYTSLNNNRLVTQCIVLPNGTTWIFAYNDRNPGDPSSVNFGIPTTITLPTGGTIDYTYTTIEFHPAAGTESWSRWVATRTVNANDGKGPHTWTYAYANVGQTAPTTTVTDPLGNNTVHTFSQAYGYRETETQIYQLIGGAQTLQETIRTAYTLLNGGSAYYPCIAAMPKSVTTIWPNGQESQVQTDYDSEGTGGFWSYGDLTAKREYDYGNGAPGALLRTTTINYKALDDSNYLANNLLDLKSSVQVTDGGGTQRAYTTYGYDAYSPLGASGITTQHDANPPAGTYRGNLTSVSKWLNTTGGYLTTNTHYFDTGEIQTLTDPNGNMTTYAYSSAYAGSLPTAVTNALNQTSNYGYDFNSGKLTSAEDPNSLTTSYTYDNMFRLATASYPNGGSASISHQETTFPFTAALTTKITASQNSLVTNVFDGVGRISQKQVSDPEGTIYTDTTYDPDGRKVSVSNPYRSTGDSTYGITSYVYDALNRTCVVAPPDGTAVAGFTCPTSQPSNDIFTSYSGNQTTVIDQAGISRKTQSDGLGRLQYVWEAPAGPNFQTSYTYDALNDLVSVLQGTTHTRSFAYDSLARLTSATNPESGSVAYTYDADSNVKTKTDAAGRIETYTYDALNRVLTETPTPSDASVKRYAYDSAACLGVPRCSLIGKLVSTYDDQGDENISYDTLDRQVSIVRNILGTTKTATYTYNYDHSLASLLYPSGRTITYATDSAGRPAAATDVANSITYISGLCNTGGGLGACYAPQGAVTNLSYGVATGGYLNYQASFSKRLQPVGVEVSIEGNPTALMSLTYNFVDANGHNNGNVAGISNLNDSTRSQQFTYDQLNRLATAETTSTFATSPTHCWGQAYVYDNSNSTPGEFGNLTNKNVPSAAYNGCTTEPLSLVANASNQITTFTYDASGNVLNDGANTYQWLVDGHLYKANATYYYYDVHGNRAQKAGSKWYWYGLGSDPLDESDTSGNITDEYVYFGGKRIAHRAVSSNTIYFYGQDALGTSRTVFTSAGVLCYDADFYPFGGERAYTNTCPPTYKFTGKERDAESGLDAFGTRYRSSTVGRFVSTDPGPFIWRDPQTLNRYTYTRDNPLVYVDPTGSYFVVAASAAPQVKEFISTQLRSEAGRQLINKIAFDPKPTTVVTGSLQRVQNENGSTSITNAQTTAVPGTTPGAFAGTTITLDFGNINTTALATGQSAFLVGLTAWTHEDFHVLDANGKTTFQQAAAALAAGDAPSHAGANDTTGGTAESQAQSVVQTLGSDATNYVENPDTDEEATQILAYGQLQQDAQNAFANAETQSPPVSTVLDGGPEVR